MKRIRASKLAYSSAYRKEDTEENKNEILLAAAHQRELDGRHSRRKSRK